MRKKRNPIKLTIYLIIGTLVFWTMLTLWAQYSGYQESETIGDVASKKKALIVYNPDPIYDLDKQICRSFAIGLSSCGYKSTIITAQYKLEDKDNYDLYVFCANTYNWAPDWLVVNFIENYDNLINKNVVAITIGSGSTIQAQKKLENIIKSKSANLVDSKSYWLMRPNDDERTEENNIDVANDLALKFGVTIGKRL